MLSFLSVGSGGGGASFKWPSHFPTEPVPWPLAVFLHEAEPAEIGKLLSLLLGIQFLIFRNAPFPQISHFTGISEAFLSADPISRPNCSSRKSQVSFFLSH